MPRISSRRRLIFRALTAAAVSFCAARGASAQPAEDRPMRLFVGTYTGPKSQGIYTLTLDPKTGQLSKAELAGEVKNPSFIAFSPDHNHLYCAGELGDFQGKKGGAVSAFSVNPATGSLTMLNQQFAGGGGSCFVSVDPAGKVALVANYGGGSVGSLPIKADGSLGEMATFVQHTGSSVDPRRQKEPHAHSINPSPDGRFALACDLGLDRVLVYKVDAQTGKMTPNDPPFAATPAGGGARHLSFHPTLPFAYVINEMHVSVTAFKWDADKGTLTEIQTVPSLPEGVKVTPKDSGAEVQVHPSGQFVYASNRGHDSITCFKVDPASGKVAWQSNTPSGGKTPRNFRVDPTGQFLVTANQGTSNLVAYRIHPETGALTPTGSTAEVGSPVCIKFLPVK